MPRESDTFPIRGLDLTTPGHQLPSGACRLLWDLVPTGRGDGAVWEVPKVATDTGVENLLSIGRHTEGRLIGVRADEVVVINPNNGYAETQVWSLPDDTTRRATFAQVEESTLVGLVTGPDVRTPELLIEVQGTTATKAQWPPLPLLTVDVEELETNTDNEHDDLVPGFYGFRWAWELQDGSIGPAPMMAWVYSDAFRWQARVTVERYRRPLPDLWRDRIRNLVLIAHAPTVSDQRVTTKAHETTGRIVKRIQQFDVGDGFTFSASTEDILADTLYDGSGLKAHEVRAGTTMAYNQRALLGDAEYDLARPNLKDQLNWRDGDENAGGDDYHVLLEVSVETKGGTITRLSEPVPFDATNIEFVSLRWSHLTYPDPRATEYQWYVSGNYTGDISAADWEVPTFLGSNRKFEDAPGLGVAFDALTQGSRDFTNRGGETIELFWQRRFTQSTKPEPAFNGFTGADFRLNKDVTDNAGELRNEQASATEVVEFGELMPLNAGTINKFVFDAELEADISSDGTVLSDAEATFTVEVRTGDGTVLASDSRTASVSDSGNEKLLPTGITLGGWTAGEAHDLRLKLECDVQAEDGSPGDFSPAVSEAYVRLYNGNLTLDRAADTSTTALSRSTTNDTNPSRIIWSETATPLDLDPANVVYAGERDRVMALAPTGQEVSASQYGEYPLIAFGESSVRLLRIGQEPFVQGVDVLTVDQGIVGRRAATTVDGRVVAALDGGVYAFSPQLEQPSLSRPLNDVDEEFLRSLGPDVAVGHYKNVERGRNDVWVAAGGRVWNYSIDQGAWSALRRQRQDFALRPGEEYAVRADGALVREGATEGEGQVNVQTAVLQAGPLGSLKRMRQVQLRQPTPLEEVDLSLVATDPQREYIKLESATLRADQVDGGVVPGAGLGTGFVLDIRGRALTGQSIESIFVEWDVRNRTVRDHQAHEYPAYLDAPDLVQSQDQTQATTLVLTSKDDTSTTLVLIAETDV